MRYFSVLHLALFFFLFMLAACNKEDEPVQPCPAVATTVALQNAFVDGRQLLWAALTDEQGRILQEHFFTAALQAVELSAERNCEASHNLALMYRRQADSSLQLDYFTRIPVELKPDYAVEQPELLPTTFRITQYYGLGPAGFPIDPRFGNALEASLDEFNHTITLQAGVAPGEEFFAYVLRDDAYYRYKARRDNSPSVVLEVPVDSFTRATFANCKFFSSVNEVVFAGIEDRNRNTFTPYYSRMGDTYILDIFYLKPEPGDFTDFYIMASGDGFTIERFVDALPEEVEAPRVYLLIDYISFPNHFRMVDIEDTRADQAILHHTRTPGLEYRVFVPTDREEVLFTPLDSLELQNRFPDLNPAFSPATLQNFEWNEIRRERYEGTDDYRQLLELHLTEPPLWRARLGYEAGRL